MNVFSRGLMIMSLLPLTSMGYALDAQVLIDHVQKSIQNAYQGCSKLSNNILKIEGMSSSKVRHFLNNLCSLPETSYLEVGVWKGSTFVSALYQNEGTIKNAIAIDNWSEFEKARDAFLVNTSKFLSRNVFNVYEQDAFTVPLNAFVEPINIYFYDGNHSVESQCKAFTHFDAVLADTFIAIVDDWMWPQVQEGTRQAFAALGYTVLFEKELLSALTGSDTENWWNGLYVAVIQKSTATTRGNLHELENSNPFSLSHVYPEDMHGWFSLANRRYLKDFIQRLHPKKAIEVGTWMGVSAIYMAKLLDAGAKLYCIDPWIPYHDMANMPECQERLKNAYERFLSNCIHHKVTDKVIPMHMTSMHAFETYFADVNDIDLIYIDGSHAEEDVYNDIMHWQYAVAPAGILCGDDWGWPSVSRAVTRASQEINKPLHIDDNFWWFE